MGRKFPGDVAAAGMGTAHHIYSPVLQMRKLKLKESQSLPRITEVADIVGWANCTPFGPSLLPLSRRDVGKVHTPVPTFLAARGG